MPLIVTEFTLPSEVGSGMLLAAAGWLARLPPKIEMMEPGAMGPDAMGPDA
jgi:hypothetical protein